MERLKGLVQEAEGRDMAFTQAGPELLLDARDTEMNKMLSPTGRLKIAAKILPARETVQWAASTAQDFCKLPEQ